MVEFVSALAFFSAKEIDEHLANNSSYRLVQEIMNTAAIVHKLDHFGIKTISELDEALRSRRDLIKKFGVAWLNRKDVGDDQEAMYFNRGICLFYLEYCMVCEPNEERIVQQYFEDHTIGGTERARLAKLLLDIFNSVNT